MPRRKILGYSILFSEWVALWAIGAEYVTGIVLAFSLFGLNLYLLFLSLQKRQIWLAVLFFFICSYSYEPIDYYLGDGIIGTHWRQVCQTPETVYQVALCCYLFLINFGLFINYYKRRDISKEPVFAFHAPEMLWISCIVLSIIMLAFGKTGNNIFQDGGYGRGGAEISTVFAYGAIPLMVALVYSNNSKRRRWVFFVMMVYILKDLLYGGRIDSIILLLTAYMLYFRHKLSIIQTFTIIVVAFIGMTIWGGFRLAVNVPLDRVASGALENMSLSTGNSGDVYYASMRIFYLMEHGYLNLVERIRSFGYFLLSVVVPFSNLPSYADLSSYLTRVYSSGGGGLAPVFIYVWCGYLGIVLVGYLLGRLITKLISGTCGRFLYFYGAFAVSTVARWYAYYPISLIKYCVYAVLFFYITEVLRTKMLTFSKKENY